MKSMLLNGMKANPHGFYLFSVSPDAYIRTVDYFEYLSVFNKVIPSARFVHFHFRYATSGLVSRENVHGWLVDKYYITHYGSVSAYANDPVYCDTRILVMKDQVFRDLLGAGDFKALYNYLLEKGFYGTMFAVSTNADKVYAISASATVYYANIDGVMYAISGTMLWWDRLKIWRKMKKVSNGVFAVKKDGVVEILKRERR